MNHRIKISWRELLLCIGLALLVWGVFGQTVRFGFVNYDDGCYVTEAPAVLRGLTPEGVVYAFTSRLADGWYPLTTMSLMLDATLYGEQPGGYHRTNVLIHLLAVLALFGALRSLTGSVWRSAFVAAVFAIHPLRAESVAWISARKDVLSGLFFFLTLWAYARYAREASGARYARMSNIECRMSNVERDIRPQAGRGVHGLLSSVFRPPVARRSLWRRRLSSGSYWLVLALFVCALMSKPTVVTLPCVLLLLDFWPLRRFATGVRDQESAIGIWKLFAEKFPLFLLAVAASAGTVFAERVAVISVEKLPFFLRAVNAMRSYAVYVLQTVWPDGLVPFYPHPMRAISSLDLSLSLLLLVAVSLVATACRKKQPWLLTGWLWYLGTLVPAIGLFVQAGSQAHADRYTYLSQTGLVLMAVWAAAEVLKKWRAGRTVLSVAAAVMLAALFAKAYVQTGIWHSGYTLWTHTIRCIKTNTLAFYNLAQWLMTENRAVEAESSLRQALVIEPENTDFLFSLGNALTQQNRLAESVPYYEKAIRTDPEQFDARMNLGGVFLRMDQPERAIDLFNAALKIRPDDPIATLLLQKAVQEEKVRREHPGVLDDLNRRAAQAQKQGDPAGAAALYRQAVELHPWHIPSLNNLAWVLSTSPSGSLRDGAKAVELAERADKLSDGKNLPMLSTLAAAYAEAGRFSDALAVSQRALKQARSAGDAAQVRKVEERMKLYRQGKPFRP